MCRRGISGPATQTSLRGRGPVPALMPGADSARSAGSRAWSSRASLPGRAHPGQARGRRVRARGRLTGLRPAAGGPATGARPPADSRNGWRAPARGTPPAVPGRAGVRLADAGLAGGTHADTGPASRSRVAGTLTARPTPAPRPRLAASALEVEMRAIAVPAMPSSASPVPARAAGDLGAELDARAPRQSPLPVRADPFRATTAAQTSAALASPPGHRNYAVRPTRPQSVRAARRHTRHSPCVNKGRRALGRQGGGRWPTWRA